MPFYKTPATFDMINIPFLFFTLLLIVKNQEPNNRLPDLYNDRILNINTNADEIIGKWMTLENNLEVQVYKKDNNFLANIIWFKMDDNTKSMNSILDEKNPNPDLRKRKWIGMEVLHDLKYDAEDNEWQGGIIYDAKHGKEWKSVVWINSAGLLKVKGYWVFRWISQTLTFKKVL